MCVRTDFPTEFADKIPFSHRIYLQCVDNHIYVALLNHGFKLLRNEILTTSS